MTIRESMVHAFSPDYFVKIGTMKDGEPEEKLLREIQQPLGEKYDTMMDIENGVIYLKKGGKSSARLLKNKLEEGDREIEGYSKLKDKKETTNV